MSAMEKSNDESGDLLSSILSHIDVLLDSEHLTLSQCLRKLFNTKQRPSRFVLQLLPKATPAEIQEAHMVIVGHLSNLSVDLPCLLSIKVVSTVIIFLQLVLESMTKIGDAKFMQMSVFLIQSLQKSVCDVLQACKLAEECDIVPCNEQHAPTLGAFVLGGLLRAINPYVSSCPVLLSPLWKGLCDIVAKTPHIPCELARASVFALLVYLKEGERPCIKSAATSFRETAQTPPDLSQHLFHAKVLCFLVARLVCLLPVLLKNSDGEEVDDGLLSDVFDVLIRVRGLSIAVMASTPAIPSSILQSYNSVEKKIDQCCLKALTMKETVNRTSLKAILSVKTSAKQTFESSCSRLGKLALMRVILRQIPMNYSNAESTLLIAEQAMLSIMPKCTIEMIGGTKCVIDSWILSITTRAAIHLDDSKGLHVRFMLLSWLARSRHPVSREAVVSVVHNYIVALGRVAVQDGSPRSSIDMDSNRRGERMIALLAQVFFDVRTATSHRVNISSVLSRLLATQNCQHLTQSVLLIEMLAFFGTLRRVGSTGRRSKFTEKGNMSNLMDWTCILDVVSRTDFSSNATLHREATSFMEALGNRNDSLKSFGIFHLGMRTPLEVALLATGTQQQPTIKLMGWFLTQTRRRKPAALLTRDGVILTYALLRSLGTNVLRAPDASTIGPVAKILTWSLEQTQILLSHHREEWGVTMALAMGELLRNIGRAISPSSSDNVVQQIAMCFRTLFNLERWSVSANTMTCLTEFASTIPKSHQGVLTKCLPVEMQNLFTSRLQGKVDRAKTAHRESDFESVQQVVCVQQLSKLTPSVPVKASPFATSSTYIMAPGSYLLSMPTAEGSGRTALVIFPPGDQSLQDIKYMLQKDTIEHEHVRMLHQVKVSEDGAGCRLYSVENG